MNKKILLIGLVLLMMLPLVSAGITNDIFITNLTGISDFGVGRNGPMIKPNYDITNITFQLFDGSSGTQYCLIWNATNTMSNSPLVGNVTVSYSGSNITCNFGTLILKKGDSYITQSSGNSSGSSVSNGFFNVANPYPINKTNIAFLNGTYYSSGTTLTLYSADTMSTWRNISSDTVAQRFDIYAYDFYTNASINNFSATVSPSYSLNNYVAGFWNLSNVDTTSANGVLDSSTNGRNGNASGYTTNNGTVSGGVTISDGAMMFNGVNAYVGYQFITTSSDLTFGGFYQINDYSNYPGLIYTNSSYSTGFGIYINNNGNPRCFYPSVNEAMPIVINVSQTYHIFCKIQSNGNLYMYLDGAEYYIGNYAVPVISESSINLGFDKFSSRYLNGSIFSSQIFNRALNSSEITEIYNAGRDSYSPIGSGLVGQWSGRDFVGTEASPTSILDKNMIVSTPDSATAWTFNGSQSIDLGNTSQFKTATFTILMDVMPSSITNARLISNNNFDSRGYQIGLGFSANRPEVRIGTGSTDNYFSDSRSLTSNVNSRLVFVYNGSHGVFYINGVAGSSSSLGTISYNSAKTTLASRLGSLDYYNGTLDDVVYINRNMSAVEVAEDYARGGFTYPIYTQNETFSTTNGLIQTTDSYFNVLRNITLQSTQSGGYFNQTYNNYNISSYLDGYMAQSVVSFTATQKISNATISGVNFTSVYLTNTTHYMSAGTYTINATKSGYFTKSESVTAVPLTSSSVVIEDMTDTKINLTVRSLINNTTVSSYTAQFNNSLYSYSQSNSTTNGTIIIDAISGNWTIYIDASGYALSLSNVNLVAGYNNITVYLYTSESVNVTFRNEITNDIINTTTTNLELISEIGAYNYSTSNGYIYFDLVSPSSYLLRYVASGYSERFSYLEISSRSNQNLTLYLLPVNVSTNVTLTVINENAQPVQEALVRVLKYDLPTNSYIEREVKFTDFAGQIIFAIEYSSEFYKFFVEYPEGETVLTTEPAYISSTTLTLQINTRSTIANLDNYLDVTSDLTFNTGTNNYRAEFSNSENLLSNVCLYVYRTDTSKTLYNTTCSTIGSQSGTILVSVLNTSGREYRADLYYNFSGDLYYARSKTVSFAQGVDWGIWGLVIVTLLTVVLVFMFKESLVIAVSVAPLPMVMGSLTGIILIPVWVSFGIEILALVLAYLISRYAQ